MADSSVLTLTVDDRSYSVAHVGDVLRVTPAGAEELAETVSIAHLPEEARTAIGNGTYDDASVRIAAQAVAQAIADRGA